MSDARAIAAVTMTLRDLLMRGIQHDADLGDINVTMLPLDKARDTAASANQLNLFLYQTVPSAAWRNQDMPGQARPGETAMPPLALNLHYLLTAFGKDNDATVPFSHVVLGRAMSVLHDHPLLGAVEIRDAFKTSDLALQVERIRVSLQPLPVEDIFRLWSGFQTQYRLSASYEVAVVLIDSLRRTRTPLPVLTRGKDDTGVEARGDVVPPFPTIEAITAPSDAPSAVLGDVVTITGHHLDGDQLVVVFSHRHVADPRPLKPAAGATAERVTVKLPVDAALWPAGPWTVALAITNAPGTKGARTRTSNEVALQIAPELLNVPVKATRAGAAAKIAIECRPEVLPAQRVSLLLGDREIVAEPRTGATGKLTFIAPDAAPGDYLVRLRVEGVDSLLVDRSPMPDRPPVFRDHRVTVR